VARLATLARTAEYEQAAVDADALAIQARLGGPAQVRCARVFALATRTAAADRALAQPVRERRVVDYVTRAMGLLHAAAAQGYFNDPLARAALTKDADWDALRPRPEFQRFVADLGTP
jgi:hypothetical protein